MLFVARNDTGTTVTITKSFRKYRNNCNHHKIIQKIPEQLEPSQNHSENAGTTGTITKSFRKYRNSCNHHKIIQKIPGQLQPSQNHSENTGATYREGTK
jgi:hypothetical protein